ncbi:asparaginase [Brucella melitensis]
MKTGRTDRPRILIVSTGGTIASRYDPQTDSLLSVSTGKELLSSLGALAPAVDVVLDEFCNLGSNRIDLDTSFRLAHHIDERLRDRTVDGCVVTHGTDTLEESAFLAQLTISSRKPVVFTGAQRSADEPDADGPRNLADAISVAASPEARDLGTLVVFAGKVLSSIDATKIHTSKLEAYDAPGYGPLGVVDHGAVFITRKPLGYPMIAAHSIETRVDLITLAMGADGRLIEAAINSGTHGFILETFGRGNATPAVVDAIARATERGIVTIITARCPDGRVLPVYGDGGGSDLEKAGAIFAGRLNGPKARILLCLSLPTIPVEELGRLFEQFGR